MPEQEQVIVTTRTRRAMLPPTGLQMRTLENLHSLKKAVRPYLWIDGISLGVAGQFRMWQQQLSRNGLWNRQDVDQLKLDLGALPDRPDRQGFVTNAATTQVMSRRIEAALASSTALQGLTRALTERWPSYVTPEQWVRGVHVVDGVIYRVGARANERSAMRPNLQAHRLNLDYGREPNNVTRLTRRPRWERTNFYQYGALERRSGQYRTCGPAFQANTLLTLEEAERLGAQYGICARCGRLLTDPHSVRNGIGPVCIQRIREQTEIRAAQEAQWWSDEHEVVPATIVEDDSLPEGAPPLRGRDCSALLLDDPPVPMPMSGNDVAGDAWPTSDFGEGGEWAVSFVAVGADEGVRNLETLRVALDEAASVEGAIGISGAGEFPHPTSLDALASGTTPLTPSQTRSILDSDDLVAIEALNNQPIQGCACDLCMAARGDAVRGMGDHRYFPERAGLYYSPLTRRMDS